jgi:Tfp pilus assembly protein PilV
MSARSRPPLTSLLREESGLSLIEILIAMIVLVVGVLGMVGGFTTARKLDLLSERRTSMDHRAQLEIERLQALATSSTTYKELLAMSTTHLPTHSTESANPDHYVNEAGTEYEYTTGTNATLMSSAKGEIYGSPTGRKCSTEYGACEWTDGNVSGSVYDFVTWDKDKLCASGKEEEEGKCPKRITVVVTAKATTGYAPTSVRVSTLIAES